jgi:hypothetical protein
VKYLKKQLDARAIDTIRINLSTQGEKLSPEPVCDWCGEDAPEFAYASKRMASGEWQACWRWLACKRCDRMIENENWDALERRTKARFKKLFGAKMQNEFKGEVSEDLISSAVISSAVKVSLDAFHEYGIQIKPTT